MKRKVWFTGDTALAKAAECLALGDFRTAEEQLHTAINKQHGREFSSPTSACEQDAKIPEATIDGRPSP